MHGALVTAQTRRGSLTEAAVNVGVGYLLNFAINLIVFPAMGATVTTLQAFVLGAPYLLVALARSYAVRRAFERGRLGG